MICPLDDIIRHDVTAKEKKKKRTYHRVVDLERYAAGSGNGKARKARK